LLYLGDEIISAEKRSSKFEGFRLLVREAWFPADEEPRRAQRPFIS
jgi:hypothetical protein